MEQRTDPYPVGFPATSGVQPPLTPPGRAAGLVGGVRAILGRWGRRARRLLPTRPDARQLRNLSILAGVTAISFGVFNYASIAASRESGLPGVIRAMVPGGENIGGWCDEGCSGSRHRGVDVGAPLGTPILAPVSGVITTVGWDELGGNVVYMRDGSNRRWYFAHLSRPSDFLERGERVARGDLIGYVGMSGNARDTVPHLHLQVTTPGGSWSDPEEVLGNWRSDGDGLDRNEGPDGGDGQVRDGDDEDRGDDRSDDEDRDEPDRDEDGGSDEDRPRPLVMGPVGQRLSLGWQLRYKDGGVQIPVSVRWPDLGDGVRYQVHLSRNGGEWQVMPLEDDRRDNVRLWLRPNASYVARVRAVGEGGRLSGWSYSRKFEISPYQAGSDSIRYEGEWRGREVEYAYGGALRTAEGESSRARLKFEGRSFAWVTTKGPDRGKARIYLDGEYLRTVDLDSSESQPRELAFTWSGSGTHTFELRPEEGAENVDLDAFLVLR